MGRTIPDSALQNYTRSLQITRERVTKDAHPVAGGEIGCRMAP
jgi:hypothetical protein